MYSVYLRHSVSGGRAAVESLFSSGNPRGPQSTGIRNVKETAVKHQIFLGFIRKKIEEKIKRKITNYLNSDTVSIGSDCLLYIL